LRDGFTVPPWLRFPRPPYNPGRPDLPGPVGNPGISSVDVPCFSKVLGAGTHPPCFRGLPTASSHILALVYPGSVSESHAEHETAKCPESLCRGFSGTGEVLSTSSEGITPPSLLRTHAPLPSPSSLLRLVASFKKSLQVVSSSCCEWDLPDVIYANLSCHAWSHTPAVTQGALPCFFPCVIGLPDY